MLNWKNLKNSDGVTATNRKEHTQKRNFFIKKKKS